MKNPCGLRVNGNFDDFSPVFDGLANGNLAGKDFWEFVVDFGIVDWRLWGLEAGVAFIPCNFLTFRDYFQRF